MVIEPQPDDSGLIKINEFIDHWYGFQKGKPGVYGRWLCPYGKTGEVVAGQGKIIKIQVERLQDTKKKDIRNLWEAIKFEENPWVWVVDFREMITMEE